MNGEEIADRCAWQFDSTFTLPNGAMYAKFFFSLINV